MHCLGANKGCADPVHARPEACKATTGGETYALLGLPPQRSPGSAQGAPTPTAPVRSKFRASAVKVIGCVGLASATLAVLLATSARIRQHRQETWAFTTAVDGTAEDETVGLSIVEVDFDCEADKATWDRSWSEVKKVWCCTKQLMSCHRPVEETPFDCEAGLANWKLGWSEGKKALCCESHDKGCPSGTDVSITFEVGNVDYVALVTAQPIFRRFLAVVKEMMVEHIGTGVITSKNITLTCWEGIGVVNTGVAVLAKIGLSTVDEVSFAHSSLSMPSFATKMASAIQHVPGFVSVCDGLASVEDVAVDFAIASPCTCVGGQAATGRECPSKGGNHCKLCEKGLHLTERRQCEANVCRCLNGVPPEGATCVVHGTEVCTVCLPGFHYDDNTNSCQPNVCSCTMGIAAKGVECTEHGAAICGSCYPGYHVDREAKICKASRCLCPQGVVVEPSRCPADGVEECASCNPGYHLESGRCIQNECECGHGVRAVGRACATHGEQLCVSCTPGFLPDGAGGCETDGCDCPNGTPSEAKCAKGVIECQRCDTGYYLKEGRCLPLMCTCENGEPLPQSACLEMGQSVCASCYSGFRLVGRHCEPNHCHCAHGTPAAGAACPSQGLLSCSSCRSGYRPHTKLFNDQGTTRTVQTCIQKFCNCMYGTQVAGTRATARSEPRCDIDGANMCLDCMPQYHMINHQCLPNRCTCEHGTPVESDDCFEHGAQNCSDCDRGYWLAEDAAFAAEPFFEKPGLEAFKAGKRLCLATQMTSAKPFNCDAGLDEWETAWSKLKLEYCCTNENKGCKPKETGTAMCEGQAYDFQQCLQVGCCTFDTETSQCNSGVGDKLCYPMFMIRSYDDRCMTAAKSSLTGGMEIQLVQCSTSDIHQNWRPMDTAQVKNSGGGCLEVEKLEAGALLSLAPCSLTNPISKKQLLVFHPNAGQIKTETNLCVDSTAAWPTLVACGPDSPNVQWTVPMLQ